MEHAIAAGCAAKTPVQNLMVEITREHTPMGRDGRNQDAFVIGPTGEKLTRADLPPPDLRRWVSRRKAEVVLAVQGGLISLDEACMRYRLSMEEFLSWEHAMLVSGVKGLKIGHALPHHHVIHH